jgi:hypothetical protein
LAAMFSFMSASQFTLFAMWFDMEANRHLKPSRQPVPGVPTPGERV